MSERVSERVSEQAIEKAREQASSCEEDFERVNNSVCIGQMSE